MAPVLRFAPVLTGEPFEAPGAAFQSGSLVTPGLCAMGGTTDCFPPPGLSLMGETF